MDDDLRVGSRIDPFPPRKPRNGVLRPDGPSSGTEYSSPAQRGFSHALSSVTISSYISSKDFRARITLNVRSQANSGIFPKNNLQHFTSTLSNQGERIVLPRTGPKIEGPHASELLVPHVTDL